MRWEEYLASKKIDSNLFKQQEERVWASWKALFDQMHPNSFTAQKLYLINSIRRKYPLVQTEVVEKEPSSKPKAKPKINMTKPKLAKSKPVFKKPKTD